MYFSFAADTEVVIAMCKRRKWNYEIIDTDNFKVCIKGTWHTAYYRRMPEGHILPDLWIIEDDKAWKAVVRCYNTQFNMMR